MAKATPELVGMSASRLERIGTIMQSYVDRGVYAGVQTIVARRGIVVHEGQYGWRDKEAGAPMSADTLFRLYSMTKPIVSTALMMLFEEGRFHLVDPVARYIPAFAGVKVLDADGSLVDPKRPIFVRDLLNSHERSLLRLHRRLPGPRAPRRRQAQPGDGAARRGD